MLIVYIVIPAECRLLSVPVPNVVQEQCIQALMVTRGSEIANVCGTSVAIPRTAEEVNCSSVERELMCVWHIDLGITTGPPSRN